MVKGFEPMPREGYTENQLAAVKSQLAQEHDSEAVHDDFDEAFDRWSRIAEHLEGNHCAVIEDIEGAGKGKRFRWIAPRGYLAADFGFDPGWASVTAPDDARKFVAMQVVSETPRPVEQDPFGASEEGS